MIAGLKIATTLVVLAATPPSALAGPIYHCNVTYAEQLNKDGELAITAWARQHLDADMSFTFSPSSGVYKATGNIEWQFDILQEGTSSNSLKAVRIYKGPVSTVLQTLSILTWDNMQYLFTDHDEIHSGSCTLAIE